MKTVIIFLTIILFAVQILNFAGTKKDILIIESYNQEYGWDASYIEGIRQVLGQKYKLHFFEMDTKRLPPTKFSKRAEMAWGLFKQIKPELLIIGDDNALKYLSKEIVKITTPVVYLGINNNPRNYQVTGFKHISGVLERPLLKRSITFINEFHKIKKVLVMFDSSTTAKVTKAEVFNNKDSLILDGIQVDIRMIGKLDKWQKAVSSAKQDGYDAIIVGLYHNLVDSSGKHVKADRVLKWTSQNTPIPPFSFWSFSVGPDKTIGGYVCFGMAQGRAAAKMALKFLKRENKGIIRPEFVRTGHFFFSKSQLKKWKLILPAIFESKAIFEY